MKTGLTLSHKLAAQRCGCIQTGRNVDANIDEVSDSILERWTRSCRRGLLKSCGCFYNAGCKCSSASISFTIWRRSACRSEIRERWV